MCLDEMGPESTKSFPGRHVMPARPAAGPAERARQEIDDGRRGKGYIRWAFVFQPKSAAYLNLIEPWWKVLRSVALQGRRFETWEEICHAITAATGYWNAHRHPFIWGRRRCHRTPRRAGIGQLPQVA